jgi:hypothetical protein
MGRPPKATCQASKHSHHAEDPLLSKHPFVKRVAPHHHALAAKIERFAPPGQIVWQVRARLCHPSHHQGHPSLTSLIRHAGP